jgi:outer membrane protein assembly factor BamB
MLIMQSRSKPVSDAASWIIDKSTTLTTQILWQKSIPCLNGYASPHGAIAVAANQVLYYDACSGFGGELVALNLVSGVETWKRSAHGLFQVAAADDGFLIVLGDSFVQKLNLGGELVWESVEFTSRSMRAVFPRGDSIYAPFRTSSGSGIYILSRQTGQITETIRDEELIALLDGFSIKQANSEIYLINNDSGQVVWTLQSPFRFPLEYPDVARIGDILLLFDKEEGAIGYNIQTGRKLWSIEKNFGSYPLMSNDQIYLYSLDNSLEVYDSGSGKLTDQTKLQRMNEERGAGKPQSSVALGSSEDIIVLAFRNTGELLTLRIEAN